MPTTFSVIVLGTAVDMDPTEGNTSSENLAAIVGSTFGGAGNPLYDNVRTWSPVGSPGNTYDVNNNPDQFSVNGTTYRYDGGGAFNATITYADGTTATVVAKIAQSTTGELFLTSETAGQEANQALLDAKPILSITITSAQAPTPGMAADRLVGNFMEAVDGSVGNDNMGVGYTDAGGDAVTDGTDVIRSGDGNDTINAGSGDDVIFGGAGNDVIDDWNGNDVVYGGAGNDTADVSVGSNTIYMDGGDDLVNIRDNAGSNTLFGGDGFDTLDFRNWQSSTAASVTFNADGSGSFSHFAGATTGTFQGFERVTGTANADTMNASAAASGVNLAGEDGNDSLTGGAGNDTLQGDAGNDMIVGGNGNDTISGGAANDTLNGGVGNDTLDGGVGIDSLFGGDGNDLLISASTDADFVPNTLSGGDGDDTIRIGGSFNGTDSIDGGNGTDLLELLPVDNRNLSVDMGAGSVADGANGAQTFTGIENITTGGGNDTIIGDVGNNLLSAGAGNDSVDGGGGSDTIYFGTGNDTVLGGTGDDYIDDVGSTAETGDNLIYGGAGNDTIWHGGGNDTVYGGDGGDYIDDHGPAVAGNSSLFGDVGNDTIWAGEGNDTVFGGADNDLLDGEAGDDGVDGGSGNDQLSGGSGADTLRGGSGNDSLTGGSGTDTFDFARGGNADVVTDFSLTDTDSDGKYDDQLDVSELRDLDGNSVNAWDVTVTDDGNGNALLTFPEGETVVLLGVSPSQMQTAQQRSAAGIPCFTSGTPILTPKGERPVEDIRAGDLVLTQGGGVQPVIWAGHRALGPQDLDAQPDLRPIHFATDSIGNSRPLRLSPQHAVTVRRPDGTRVLARARHLSETGMPGVRVARGVRAVTYHHLLLPRHAILWAAGAGAESFYPGPEALRMLGEAQCIAVIAALRATLSDKLGMPTKLTPDVLVQLYGPRALPLAMRADPSLYPQPSDACRATSANAAAILMCRCPPMTAHHI